MKTLTVGTVLLSGVVLTGCGGDAKTAGTPAPASAPSAPAAPATTPTSVSTPAGNAAVGSLPADFPKDIPVYTGAGITSASTAGGNVGAVLTTADAPEKVVEFYKAELEKNGWSKPQAVSAAGTNSVIARKEKRQLAVGITKAADGKTNISIGVTPMP
jgi:hypothetical protein